MSLIWFAREMEKRLEANDHKTGWGSCSLQYLSMRLTQERRELERAIKNKDIKNVIEECADIANFAMMIADNVGNNLYDWKED